MVRVVTGTTRVDQLVCAISANDPDRDPARPVALDDRAVVTAMKVDTDFARLGGIKTALVVGRRARGLQADVHMLGVGEHDRGTIAGIGRMHVHHGRQVPVESLRDHCNAVPAHAQLGRDRRSCCTVFRWHRLNDGVDHRVGDPPAQRRPTESQTGFDNPDNRRRSSWRLL